MLLIVLISQLALAFIVILGLLLSRPTTRKRFIGKAVGALLFMAGLGLTGVWVWPPYYGYIALVLLLLAVIIFGLKKSSLGTDSGSKRRFLLPTLFSGVLGCVMIFYGIKGRIAPAGSYIDLVPPLASQDNHCVLSGGASMAVNLHYIVGPNGAVNEEIHSIDFMKLSGGFRTRAPHHLNPKPVNPEDYAIFGSEIFAPCSGVVVGVETSKKDQLAGHKYRDRTGPNHVTLLCSGTQVLLAHLKYQSSHLAIGDKVQAGDLVGLVGNTGNTEEPHLHIHASKPPEDRSGNTARLPVPMRFNGKFLSRGDCL